MSGRDDTSAPPDRNGVEPEPHPPTPAPPSFGRSTSGAEPSVVFQAADAPPDVRTDPGPSVAHDAEETMTPPPQHPGASVPDADKTMTASPPYGPTAGGRPLRVTYEAAPPYAQESVPDAERTVTDPRPAAAGAHWIDPRMSGTYQGTAHPTEAESTRVDPDEEKTMAVARFGASTQSASGASGPELTPDAILPPGTQPEEPPEPPNDLGGTSTGPIPRLSSGHPPFNVHAMPPQAHGAGYHPAEPSGSRRALLVGGGLLGVLILVGGAVLGFTELSSGPPKHHAVARSAPPPPPKPTPSPTHVKHKPKPKPQPVDIRDEKKDPKPLTISEVFPSHHVKIAGRTFVLAKTIINDRCNWTANAPFSDELTREHCRRVVRATFVSTDKKLAVTTGIAVMPTDAAASATLKVQDPAHYKWFRGMTAPGAPKIDHAGGYATSTLRGRYISYAYATYADGHKPSSKDKTLKSVGTAFRDYTVRPIERRAKHH